MTPIPAVVHIVFQCKFQYETCFTFRYFYGGTHGLLDFVNSVIKRTQCAFDNGISWEEQAIHGYLNIRNQELYLPMPQGKTLQAVFEHATNPGCIYVSHIRPNVLKTLQDQTAGRSTTIYVSLDQKRVNFGGAFLSYENKEEVKQKYFLADWRDFDLPYYVSYDQAVDYFLSTYAPFSPIESWQEFPMAIQRIKGLCDSPQCFANNGKYYIPFK